MSLHQQVARWLRSQRGALGSATALDLTVRIADVRAALGGAGEVLTPLVSLVGGTLAAGRFGDLTTWLLFAIAFYFVTPRVFPTVVRETVERRGFRVLFAAGAVWVGRTLGGATTPLTLADLAAPFVAAIALATASVLYFRFVAGWDLLGPDGEAVELLDRVVAADMRAERRRDRARPGALGVLADGVHLAGVGTVVVLAASALGVLATALGRAYPLPDLLVVGYLLFVPVARWRGWSTPSVGDVEERVLLGAREGTRTLKGAMLSLLAGLGLFGAAGFLFLGVGLVPGVVSLVRVSLDVDPTVGWVAVGGLVCFVTAGGHVAWLWLRTFRRLPAFLARWRGATDLPDPPVARPLGAVVPGLVAFLAGAGCILAVDDPTIPALALCWPAVPVAVGGVVVATRRAPIRDSMDGEDHRITAGVLAEFLVLFTTAGAAPAVEAGVPPVGAVVDALVTPYNAVAVVGIVGSAYLADAAHYSFRHEDSRRLAGGGYLLGMGGAVALVGVVGGGPTAATYTVAGAVVALCGVAVGVTQYYHL